MVVATSVQLTIRITQEQLAFLKDDASGPGSPNEKIRRVIEDARTFLVSHTPCWRA